MHVVSDAMSNSEPLVVMHDRNGVADEVTTLPAHVYSIMIEPGLGCSATVSADA